MFAFYDTLRTVFHFFSVFVKNIIFASNANPLKDLTLNYTEIICSLICLTDTD